MRGFKLAAMRYTRGGRGGATGWFKGFDLFGRRWGFDHSTAYVGNEKYLTRWIVYLNGYTLRVHKFYRGDDDSASHTHPWWFVTFPLGHGYTEYVYDHGTWKNIRVVTPWRFHFRPANFEHYVVCRAVKHKGFWFGEARKGLTWYTLVLTGPKQSTWGFYPKPGKFVNWKDY